jgi:hypothetical protein
VPYDAAPYVGIAVPYDAVPYDAALYVGIAPYQA